MGKFIVGNEYISTCWFSGGMHYYKCTSRTETTVTFSPVYHELDGNHQIEETTYDILTDNHGEYILFYEYKGYENRMYA